MPLNPSWSETSADIAGGKLFFARAGRGAPLLVLHRDIGTLERLNFYDALTERFEVLVPHHPGYGRSERLPWMRSVRDIAVVHQWLLAELGLSEVSLMGLGFGGWVAAEMATMAPGGFRNIILVGAMGIKPPEGDILDQALLNYIDYARAGFHDQAAFDRVYGRDPTTDQLEQWDICREMTFRVAWKPYMYSQTLPHLLDGVRARALVVWGDKDRIVPQSAGRVYEKSLRDARFVAVRECGHAVEMEQPAELAALVADCVSV
jgi:pimeloyl-ACP methyl ester carboxylesterase